MMDMVNILKNQEVFRRLTDRELQGIAPHFRLIYCQHRQILFQKGDPIENVYLVVYGSFKIQEILGSSAIKIFNFLSKGEFLGVAMAGLPNPQYPTSAQSNEDSTLLQIPLQFFFDELMQIPEVRKAVNRQISERFLEFQNDICKSQALVPHRVADFLLRLLDREGSASQGRISIPLTRVDIADRIGAKSETVIRVMSQWTKAGWLKTEEGYVEILEPQALMEVRRERPSRKITTGASADTADVEQ